MSEEEKLEIINIILSSLRTNARTINQLPETYDFNRDDYMEISSGRRILLDDVKTVFNKDILKTINDIKKDIEDIGPGIYVISTIDTTQPSDSNVFSAKRVIAEIRRNQENLGRMFVRKDIDDTVNGLINFQKGIAIGAEKKGIKLYVKQDGVLFIDGTVAVSGDIVSFATGEKIDVPTLTESIQVDGTTISKEGGVLHVVGGTGGSFSESAMWDALGGSATNQQISHDHLTTALNGYLTEHQDISHKWTTDQNKINNWDTAFGWGNHALAGYALASDLSNYLPISKYENGVYYIDGTVAVTGDVVLFANNGTIDVPTLTESILVDGTTISKEGGVLHVVGGTGSSFNEAMMWDALGGSLSNTQISSEHLTTALAGYATETWVGQQGYLTEHQDISHKWTTNQSKINNWDAAYGWGNHANGGYLTSHQDISHKWTTDQNKINNWDAAFGWGDHALAGYAQSSALSNYLPLAGGIMNAGARISASEGDLYLGNASNLGWVKTQNICSAAGEDYWSIDTHGGAEFSDIAIHNSNCVITTDIDYAAYNVGFNFSGKASLVIEPSNVRGGYNSEIDLGTDSYPWKNIYGGWIGSNTGKPLSIGANNGYALDIDIDNNINIRNGAKINGLIQAYAYNGGLNKSCAAITLDKPGDSSYGIGPDGTSMRVKYGAATLGTGVWDDNYNIEHYFKGNIVASGEVTCYSDMRLKSDIHTLKNRGELRPVTYIKDGKQSIGFIAQEVREIYPELTTEDNSKERYLSVNYAQLTAVLAAQVNELKHRIQEMEVKYGTA